MDEFTTVEELDIWASRHGLMEDDMVNLRRLQLLADGIVRRNENDSYICNTCNSHFKEKKNLLRHNRTAHAENKHYQCSVCSSQFDRADALQRHSKIHTRKRQSDNSESSLLPVKKSKPNQSTPMSQSARDFNERRGTCIWCTQSKVLLPNKTFCATCSQQGRECKWCHRPLPERFYSLRTDICDRCIHRRDNWKSRQQQGGGNVSNALEGTVQTEIIEPDPGNIWDILQFFVDNRLNIENKLINRLSSVKGMKWFMTLIVKFVKYNQNNETVNAEPTFRSLNFTCSNVSQIKEQMAEAFQHLHNSYQNFERDGSGWSIDRIIRLELNTAEYAPLEGSSYIPLPKKILKKKAVLNIRNHDNKCFLWSVLASIHPVSRKNHPCYASHYIPYEQELKLEIDFPTPLSQIPAFEKSNGVSINVFGLENEQIYPLQITSFKSMLHHVNLLLFSKGEIRHYCLIRNLSRLLGDRTAYKGKMHYCNFCLHGFTTSTLRREHIPYCSPHGPQKLSFPKHEEQQWVNFSHICKQLKVPFVIYADLESYLKPISGCEPSPAQSYTAPYQTHEPSGFCYMVKCANDELSKPARVYRGSDVIDTFFDWLLEEEEHICDILSKVQPIKLTTEEEMSFHKATVCHICKLELGSDRVRDHCHLSGTFRGASHSHCNLQFQFRQGKRSRNSKFYIPIIFHNLRGYDMHLLMESAGKYKNKKLSCIPNNMEKYISFTLGNLRFIDSLQFLNASLDSLVTNLADEGPEKFPVLTGHFPNIEQRDLLMRKGVYPYDHVTSFDVFNEKSLPPKHAFYNRLTDSCISDADYDHARQVWETFQMTSFGQYHDLYLQTDVLLLVDVFENFRQMCLDYYQLDAAHYFTSPNLAWDAMLKMTEVDLQLLNDIDMVLMIEQGMRGGVSVVNKKYARANNVHVSGYDPTKPTTWLTYLDMNNLYGTSMSEPLPEKDFCWLDRSEIDTLDIMTVPDDAETGYILEIDMQYPTALHRSHNCYPMAAERIKVTTDMLSPHSQKLRETLNLPTVSSVPPKLVPNLYSKQNYVLHYKNLKYYLSHGLELTKIHRVIAFTQSAWLKPYVDFNTVKRRLAKNDFEKDFFKLMNNSVFGKTMENMRKRVSVELINDSKRLKKVCSKPNFQSFKIFNDNLVAASLKKVNVILNRPIYAGFTILEVSKVFMYSFHYDHMKESYGDKAELLFTDTDSLCYAVEVDDWYQEMSKHRHLFDTSNYDKDHCLYSVKNCKVLGKMKDECAGTVVEEFVGLRPKMYSLKYGNSEKRTAKGVKKTVIDKELKHEAYRACLTDNCIMRHKMNLIRSYGHQLYSVTMNKISLSPYDDKRYFLASGDSYAFGHVAIAES